MPKPETDVQYHVTLRSPIGIKLGGEIAVVRSFDATVVVFDDALGYEFKVDRIWSAPAAAPTPRRATSAVFHGVIITPRDNIAGMVPQPFMDRQ